MPLSCPRSWGYCSSSASLSISSVWYTYRLFWMSVMPGSQNRLSTFTRSMLMSPRPPSLPLSHVILYTHVPYFILAHIASLHVASKAFCSSTHGTIADSIFASCLSPSSRGKMFGSGYDSTASACLLTMTLCSHELRLRKPLYIWFPVFSSSAWLCSFHHCSAAIMRRSVLALPTLYSCSTRENSCSCSRVITSSGGITCPPSACASAP